MLYAAAAMAVVHDLASNKQVCACACICGVGRGWTGAQISVAERECVMKRETDRHDSSSSSELPTHEAYSHQVVARLVKCSSCYCPDYAVLVATTAVVIRCHLVVSVSLP